MEKPKPQELVIENSPHEERVIYFYVNTDEAVTWVLETISEFGKIIDARPYCNYIALQVSPCYSRQETLAYLRHAWAEARSPVQWPESIS